MTLALPLDVKQRAHVKSLLESKTTFATTLLALVIDNYGTEAFEWDNAILIDQLNSDFNAKMPHVNGEKIAALILCMTSNHFQQSWEVFSNVCQVLSNDESNFDHFSPADPEEMAWGRMEVMMNDNPDEKNQTHEFSGDVAAYVGTVLYQDGIFTAPKFLEFAILPYKDPITDLETSMTDDLEMFEAARQNQDSKRRAVEEYVAKRYNALMAELKNAPISHRADS